MATTTKKDVPAADAGLPSTLRQIQIEARCATVRRAAEDNYRRVAVSAVANEPRGGVSVAAGLVEGWVQAALPDHIYESIAAVLRPGPAARGRVVRDGRGQGPGRAGLPAAAAGPDRGTVAGADRGRGGGGEPRDHVGVP